MCSLSSTKESKFGHRTRPKPGRNMAPCGSKLSVDPLTIWLERPHFSPELMRVVHVSAVRKFMKENIADEFFRKTEQAKV